ncbi:hypothetical protein EWM64_g9733, partial [Hericium alpestre]
GGWHEELKTITGGDYKRALFLDGAFPSGQLFDQFKAPLAELIYDLRKSFRLLYSDEYVCGFSPEALAACVAFLSKSEGVMDIFDKHLKKPDWPTDDAGRDNLEENTKKRSHDQSSVRESLVQSQTKRARLLEDGSGDSEQMRALS